MKVDLYNSENKKVGSVDLPDEVFAAEVNEGLLWEQVKAQRASRRRGTHKTKKRGEVSGVGIKPFKQKGSGQARQGSIRAPNHVGGGKVFGPVPRDYSYRLPRSARRAALKSALSLRAKQGLMVVDKFEIDKPRTKRVVEFLKGAKVSSALFVDLDNDGLRLSARNLPKDEVGRVKRAKGEQKVKQLPGKPVKQAKGKPVFLEAKYVAAGALNVYDILDYDTLVLTKAALDAVVRLATGETEAAAA